MDDAPNSSAIQRPCPLVFAGTQRFLVAVCSSRRRSRNGFSLVFQRNPAMSYAFPREPVIGLCAESLEEPSTPRHQGTRHPGASQASHGTVASTKPRSRRRTACVSCQGTFAPASLSCSLKLPAPQRFLAAARRRPRPAFRGLRGRRVFSPSLWAASSRLASRAPSFLSPTRTALLFSLGETLPVSQR